MKTVTWESVHFASEQFVDGLDRALLTALNVDTRTLVSVESAMRYWLLNRNDIEVSDYTLAQAGDDAIAVAREMQTSFSKVENDVYFWWEYAREPLWNKDIKKDYRVRWTDIDLRFVMADNPDKLDYFAMGIWDFDYIDRCIANGIDATLAADLGADQAINFLRRR